MQTQETELLPTLSADALATGLGDNPFATNAMPSSNAVLPEQFYHTPSCAEQHRGVANLMRAVLEDALKCFQRQFSSHTRREQRLAQEAQAWLFATDDSHLFSFDNICHVLDIDPQYLQAQLRRWQQHSAKPRLKKKRQSHDKKTSVPLAA